MATWEDLNSALDHVSSLIATLGEESAQVEAALNTARSSLDAANANIVSLTQQLEAARTRIAELEAAQNPDPEPEPEPQPVSKFVVGSRNRLSIPDLERRTGAKLAAQRSFASNMSPTGIVSAIKTDAAAGRQSHVSNKPVASDGTLQTWAPWARGDLDSQIRILADQYAAAAKTPSDVWATLQHEPENDFKGNATARDNWVKGQLRTAPIFTAKGIKYGVIFMGYHQIAGQGEYPLWQLEKCIPDDLADKIDFVGFDVYNDFGTNGSTAWKNFTPYFKVMADFCKPRGLEFGLSEVAYTAKAHNDPRGKTWQADNAKLLKDMGGSFWLYFNTNQNNTDPANPWEMEPGGGREVAFGNLLKQYA